MKKEVKIDCVVIKTKDGFTVTGTGEKNNVTVSDLDLAKAIDKFKNETGLSCVVVSLINFSTDSKILPIPRQL
jgi:hypothetical protein